MGSEDARSTFAERVSAWYSAALPPNSIRRVAVVFVLLFLLLLQLITATLAWGGWAVIQSFTAESGAILAKTLGVDAEVSGSLILLPSRTLSVDTQCTGYTLAVLYIALVLAYPLGAKLRVLAIAIGLPLLFLANVGRLAIVAFASERLADQPFQLMHDYLMEFGMVFVLIMIWAVWLALARDRA